MLVCFGSVVPAMADTFGGSIVSHNGTGSSPPGSGEVDVLLIDQSFFYLAPYREYIESATHVAVAEIFGGRTTEIFLNSTPQSWAGLRLELVPLGNTLPVDYRGAIDGSVLPMVNPVEFGNTNPSLVQFITTDSISLAGSLLIDNGTVDQLLIWFDDPVDPGEQFEVTYSISIFNSSQDEFLELRATTIVPEPSTLALSGIAVCCMFLTIARSRRSGRA